MVGERQHIEWSTRRPPSRAPSSLSRRRRRPLAGATALDRRRGGGGGRRTCVVGGVVVAVAVGLRRGHGRRRVVLVLGLDLGEAAEEDRDEEVEHDVVAEHDEAHKVGRRPLARRDGGVDPGVVPVLAGDDDVDGQHRVDHRVEVGARRRVEAALGRVGAAEERHPHQGGDEDQEDEQHEEVGEVVDGVEHRREDDPQVGPGADELEDAQEAEGAQHRRVEAEVDVKVRHGEVAQRDEDDEAVEAVEGVGDVLREAVGDELEEHLARKGERQPDVDPLEPARERRVHRVLLERHQPRVHHDQHDDQRLEGARVDERAREPDAAVGLRRRRRHGAVGALVVLLEQQHAALVAAHAAARLRRRRRGRLRRGGLLGLDLDDAVRLPEDGEEEVEHVEGAEVDEGDEVDGGDRPVDAHRRVHDVDPPLERHALEDRHEGDGEGVERDGAAVWRRAVEAALRPIRAGALEGRRLRDVRRAHADVLVDPFLRREVPATMEQGACRNKGAAS